MGFANWIVYEFERGGMMCFFSVLMDLNVFDAIPGFGENDRWA